MVLDTWGRKWKQFVIINLNFCTFNRLCVTHLSEYCQPTGTNWRTMKGIWRPGRKTFTLYMSILITSTAPINRKKYDNRESISCHVENFSNLWIWNECALIKISQPENFKFLVPQSLFFIWVLCCRIWPIFTSLFCISITLSHSLIFVTLCCTSLLHWCLLINTQPWQYCSY